MHPYSCKFLLCICDYTFVDPSQDLIMLLQHIKIFLICPDWCMPSAQHIFRISSFMHELLHFWHYQIHRPFLLPETNCFSGLSSASVACRAGPLVDTMLSFLFSFPFFLFRKTCPIELVWSRLASRQITKRTCDLSTTALQVAIPNTTSGEEKYWPPEELGDSETRLSRLLLDKIYPLQALVQLYYSLMHWPR